MKTLKLTKFNDPGHGWLRVPKKILASLGVPSSSYSYENKTYGYLEEDCDAPKFLRLAEAAGYTVEITNKYTNKQSHIRRMEPYNDPMEDFNHVGSKHHY